MRRSVLIICNDAGLGGTSRSALVSAKAWATQNIAASFLCPPKTNETRLALFKIQGFVWTSARDVEWDLIEFVHFHFSNYSVSQREIINELIKSMSVAGVRVPVIINDIFASPDYVFKKWPARRATSVLGRWARSQYLSHQKNGERRIPYVIGNPQDERFFRPPTESERRTARSRFGIGSDVTVVFRPGSPTMAKWSFSYISLAERLEKINSVLLLAGAPTELVGRLIKKNLVYNAGSLGDDSDVRDAYWASDVVAVDASRGESFGNVITESLLCGVPVVYRAREFRDNTPWEFSGIKGFFYCQDINKYLNAVIDIVGGVGSGRRYVCDRDSVISRYGLAAIGKNLLAVKNHPNFFDGKNSWVDDCNYDADELPRLKNAKIWALHNVFVTFIKQYRLIRGSCE